MREIEFYESTEPDHQRGLNAKAASSATFAAFNKPKSITHLQNW